ncbi:MAG: 1-(5-phosphoribosyl)-5-[(5-phosphoribosylamino)methylideneamino]imidazole-4-carboxamide isomerase [Candidatus Omnitrophica bacterium]|nr:1-(5-phosphoribosyl)-5-[(5-phosphoribosylamino)methylideneamino]imidazole-4-carboxamide isomerase [Candidatus Omnitrophota bacterium]MDD5652960.1 1-(5-phosphoribosyl)-5-[(5-phosphoribosylamino)methylideneamino]imidazole-4-carboxamide isomerase [Candidatus Omnitrophota bacterium]
MLIIPAIDLQDGAVVRFVQGKLDKKIYSRDPLKTAKHWVRQGAAMLHVVDLDGAFSGGPKNLAIVKEIIKSINIPVEFGGGVRNMELIKELVSVGVGRVILGTKAIEDNSFLKKAFAKFKEKIIISIDSKDDNLLVKGWQSTHKGLGVVEFVQQLKEIGFEEIIYTDITKDGTLVGPNIKGIKNLLKQTGMKIIASGGISSLADLAKLKLMEKQGVTGIIIGKALYEGKFTLKEALKYS